MKNNKVTYKSLIKKLNAFRNARGWVGLESEDLAKSIVLESAELLEHFQWDYTYFKKNKKEKDKNIDKIAFEVADIFIYLLQFCIENEIDLLEVSDKKIDFNSIKYPVKEIKEGGSQAYDKAKSRFRINN